MNRRDMLLGGAAMAAAPLSPGQAQPAAANTLRVAMTVADIPLITGQPSQGAEGNRFGGITVYDPLIAWDLSSSDRAAALKPGLAERWSVADDGKTWTFDLRSGVRFHDGSLFDAEAVAFNLGKLIDRDAPQFDRMQAAQGSLYSTNIARWRVKDASTIEVETKTVDAVFPYLLANVFMSSPARWREMGQNWERVATQPSGTGPYVVERVVARERLEARRFADHWNEARRPKHERLALIPMPDALTRVAALLSGQVDFVEAPPPDAVPRIRAAGHQVVTNAYPHIWCHQLSMLPDSPFRDVRVRQAANLAINRPAMVQMLGGLAQAAKGMVNENHPWFGAPSFKIEYDPDKARRLLAEAGYSRANPMRTKFIIAPSGSGQMQPLPMNELVKAQLEAAGFQVTLQTMDWNALLQVGREGRERHPGISGINISRSLQDPFNGMFRFVWSRQAAPAGSNWGHYRSAEMDALIDGALAAFDPAQRLALLTQIHEKMSEDAVMLWVVHDLNPRAMSPRVRGFVQAQSWFQDLTPITIAPR